MFVLVVEILAVETETLTIEIHILSYFWYSKVKINEEKCYEIPICSVVLEPFVAAGVCEVSVVAAAVGDSVTVVVVGSSWIVKS